MLVANKCVPGHGRALCISWSLPKHGDVHDMRKRRNRQKHSSSRGEYEGCASPVPEGLRQVYCQQVNARKVCLAYDLQDETLQRCLCITRDLVIFTSAWPCCFIPEAPCASLHEEFVFCGAPCAKYTLQSLHPPNLGT